MLDRIKIASPCTADWDSMEGDDRVRFCAQCQKRVYNLSAMTRREAESLLQITSGNLCARIYRRADGTVLTEDCPVGLRAKAARVRRRVSWAISGALSFATAWGQNGSVISGIVRSSGGEPVAKASVTLKGPSLVVETIADDKGNFQIEDLPAGTYSMIVAGSVPQKIEVRKDAAIELVFQQAPTISIMGEVVPIVPRKPWWRRWL